ncbi:hypothetical protein AAE478_005599 [Parahypoxylon ruwenzoriense]
MYNNTPTVRFTNVEALFQEIDRVSGDFLVVTDVSPQNFTEISLEKERKGRGFRLRRYHADTGVLIIIIPTRLYEALHVKIYEAFRDQLVRGNQEDSWETIGAATFRKQGHPNGDGGEGDSTGGPTPDRAGLEDRPTLVIEAGASEPLSELRRDMYWWFSASNHQVKIILLIKFEYAGREILIEKWEEEQPTRLGATTTRQAATALKPVLRQSITIARNTATNPASYHVTGGVLVLSFRLLFLRNPGSHEGDFIISTPKLGEFAGKVCNYVRD